MKLIQQQKTMQLLKMQASHTKIVRMLPDLPLARGVNASDNLAVTCSNGHTEIVRLFLDLPLERGVYLAVNNKQVSTATQMFAPGFAVITWSKRHCCTATCKSRGNCSFAPGSAVGPSAIENLRVACHKRKLFVYSLLCHQKEA